MDTLSPDRFSLDFVSPREVVEPRSESELCEAVARANTQGLAVVIWGGGTQVRTGAAPERYDIAMSTGSLAGVVEHRPADMVVTVRCGTPFASIQAALLEHGQRLPWNPRFPDRATAGGLVATNGTGGWRWMHGTPRDSLLHTRAVMADGTVFQGGAKVVKSVAGYDIPRLLCNSWGTLAVLTEVTLKTAPIAEDSARMSVTVPADELEPLVAALLESHLELVSMDWMNGTATSGHSLMVVELAGMKESVEWQKQQLTRIWGFCDEPTLSSSEALEACDALPVGVRCSTMSDRVADLCYRFSSIDGCEVVAHVGSGIVLAFHPVEAAAWELNSVAANADCRYTFTHLPTAAKATLGVWHDAGRSQELMRRIKSAFDPLNTLAPGRYVVDEKAAP